MGWLYWDNSFGSFYQTTVSYSLLSKPLSKTSPHFQLVMLSHWGSGSQEDSLTFPSVLKKSLILSKPTPSIDALGLRVPPFHLLNSLLSPTSQVSQSIVFFLSANKQVLEPTTLKWVNNCPLILYAPLSVFRPSVSFHSQTSSRNWSNSVSPFSYPKSTLYHTPI